MSNTYGRVAIAISAIENVSPIPVNSEDIKRMLSTGERGRSSHGAIQRRQLRSPPGLAIVFDISDDDFARTHVRARTPTPPPMPTSMVFVLEIKVVPGFPSM